MAPQASRSTRTRTPSRARSARASANSRPISPSQYTNVSRSIVCSRLVDRLEHRREDLVAVAQDVDAVALGRGYADDAFDGAPRRRRPAHSAVGHALDRARARRSPGHDASPAGWSRGSRSGSECSTFSASCGLRSPARTASSCAATAPPNKHGHRREQAPRAAARPCRPRARTSGRTTCST